MTTQNETIWDELENPAIESIAELYSWGLNYEQDKNPFFAFCDIIGWSDEHMGENFLQSISLDFVGSDYVAKALTDYATKPNDVSAYIEKLMHLSWDD
jgi:hypothetical protein